jgi:hypothetical protein
MWSSSAVVLLLVVVVLLDLRVDRWEDNLRGILNDPFRRVREREGIIRPVRGGVWDGMILGMHRDKDKDKDKVGWGWFMNIKRTPYRMVLGTRRL